MSRLDRLFTLLSTSTSASARHLAAQQLGEVQKTYPDELHSLLSRLHPLLRSKRWETRIAAAGALSSILKEVPQFRPNQDEDSSEEELKDIPVFVLADILGDEDTLLNANAAEDDSSSVKLSSEEQKKRLNKEMGLDVAAQLGICPDLVQNEDLEEDKNLSVREKNAKKRMKRRQAKEKDESSKRLKIAAEIYSVTDAEKDSLSSKLWPLEIFTQYLRKDLKSQVWEERHGAATALREIITIHGKSAGKSSDQSVVFNQQIHLQWFHEVATELLTVLARDRFGDFVSDQVVAPVRETTAMALGNLMKLMNNRHLKAMILVLLELSRQEDWECRHGAFLGLKYLLNVVNLDREIIVESIYPQVFRGLKDVVDDVVSEAAATLIPVVKQFIDCIDVEELSELLWNGLTDLDDLTGSTQSTMKLLAEVLNIRVPTHSKGSLKDLVPRLIPFLHHSSGKVRKAALQTLVSLASKSSLAKEFLPEICGSLLTHLYQRALFEHEPENLDLIEAAWGHVCDYCPLSALLTSTCPLFGHWLSVISRPPLWPLPHELLVKAKKDQQYFLGGTKAQQALEEAEKKRLATRARCLSARLLGKLAGYIAQPVPGFDYSKEPLSPIEMFSQKILLVNLTKSAFQCTAIGLLVMSWCEHHQEQVKISAPESLKASLWKHLSYGDNLEFDETGVAFQQIQTDASDLLATLKYHKIFVLPEDQAIPHKPILAEIQALVDFLLENETKKHRIKPSRSETLISRQKDIISRFGQVKIDMSALSTMTMSALAGALISLGHLPEKLNPVIKPLMESVKKESLAQLQTLSAQKLIHLLDLCIKHKMPNPAEKVTRNLLHFACPPSYLDEKGDLAVHSILTLYYEEDTEANQDRTSAALQVRGTKEALKAIATHFNQELTSKPPRFFERVVLPFQEDHLWRGLCLQELIQFLYAFHVSVAFFEESMHKETLKTFECLAHVLCHSLSICRYLAAQCLASLAFIKPHETISAVINHVIPLLENPQANFRQGAIEAMTTIVNRLGLNFVPYIVLFIVPVLGRMSDPDSQVRQLAASMFADLIKLVPLDQDTVARGNGSSSDLPPHLMELKLKQQSFLDELMSLKKVADIVMPVNIKAELRSYQLDGIKWLSFLNKYRLHGILCDDMGLGKTLQTICMLAMDHWKRGQSRQSPCPSLIICPASLCFHWSSEIKKFITDQVSLVPFVYNGAVAQRQTLRAELLNQTRMNKDICNLAVITSYEIARSDADLFRPCHWNYLVLDEGHAIRNAKTKTTLAIKSLQAHHRLILSGTPIQNSVLELWSLFDFLMPGFLGTERQFNGKYTKPIVGSRGDNGKNVSKENKEAGALAMEALHRQVLPFVLRRMKEDVLKDLPPKITQDYYCELSPVQKLLYEDFAKEQKDKKKSSGEAKTHVFQALQYLRKVCNHPKLVLHPDHKHYSLVQKLLSDSGSNLNALSHATKLPALQQLLHECGIGLQGHNTSIVGQHRALVFCQLKVSLEAYFLLY